MPEGYELAADVAALKNRCPRLVTRKVKRAGHKKLLVKVKCPNAFESCHGIEVDGYKAGTRSPRASSASSPAAAPRS